MDRQSLRNVAMSRWPRQKGARGGERSVVEAGSRVPRQLEIAAEEGRGEGRLSRSRDRAIESLRVGIDGNRLAVHGDDDLRPRREGDLVGTPGGLPKGRRDVGGVGPPIFTLPDVWCPSGGSQEERFGRTELKWSIQYRPWTLVPTHGARR